MRSKIAYKIHGLDLQPLHGFWSFNLALHAMKYIVLLTIILAIPAYAGVDLVKVDKSERKIYLLDGDDIIKEYHVAFGVYPVSTSWTD